MTSYILLRRVWRCSNQVQPAQQRRPRSLRGIKQQIWCQATPALSAGDRAKTDAALVQVEDIVRDMGARHGGIVSELEDVTTKILNNSTVGWLVSASSSAEEWNTFKASATAAIHHFNESIRRTQSGSQQLGDYLRNIGSDLLIYVTDESHSATEKQARLQQYSDQAAKWLQSAQAFETQMEEIIDYLLRLRTFLNDYIAKLKQDEQARLNEINSKLAFIDELIPKLQEQFRKAQNEEKGACGAGILGVCLLVIPGTQAIGAGLLASGAVVGFQAASTASGIAQQISEQEAEKASLTAEKTRILNGTTFADVVIIPALNSLIHDIDESVSLLRAVDSIWLYCQTQIRITLVDVAAILKQGQSVFMPEEAIILRAEMENVQRYWFRLGDVMDTYANSLAKALPAK